MTIGKAADRRLSVFDPLDPNNANSVKFLARLPIRRVTRAKHSRQPSGLENISEKEMGTLSN
jgi:hypothetical protein